MRDHENRTQLFMPYSELTLYHVGLINTLVKKRPDLDDVVGALHILIDEIENRFLWATENDIFMSITNAAVEVAPSIAHLSPQQRGRMAHIRVKRWFNEFIETPDDEGADVSHLSIRRVDEPKSKVIGKGKATPER